MSEVDRQSELLALWLKRPAGKRMENDVLMFYGEIVKNRPDLVVIGKGDPYQQLKVLLRGYVLDL